MRKSILIGALILLISLSVFIIYRVEKLNNDSIEFLSAIPDNSFLIIGSEKIDATILKLNETSSIWKNIKQSSQVNKNFDEATSFLNLLDVNLSSKFAIIFSGNKDNYNTIILVSAAQPKHEVSILEKEFNTEIYYEYKLKENTFFVYKFQDFIYASKKLSSIQDVVTTVKSSAFLTSKVVDYFTSKRTSGKDFFVISNNSLTNENFKQWVYYDGEISIDNISLVGAYSLKDRINGQISLQSSLPQKYNYTINAIDDSLSFASEIAYIQTKEGKAVLLKLKKSIKYTLLHDKLIQDSTNPQKFSIKSEYFKEYFEKKWLDSEIIYGIEDVDFAVFSENSALSSAIAFEMKNKSFREEKDLVRLTNQYSDNSQTENAILKLLSDSKILLNQKFYYTNDEHLALEKIELTKESEFAEEQREYLWQKVVDSDVLQGPFIIKNHRTNNQEILVVDKNHQLKLYGINGELKWTKPIGEKIIGGLEQVDILNNKKLQILFNTASKLYLIDILGNDVVGFPVASKDHFTNQVAPIDYDKNKNYRFILATNKQLVAFDNMGKKVSGFSHQFAQSEVNSQLRHFQLSGKDYLVFNDAKGKLYFLNRKGEERHKSTSKASLVNVFSTLSLSQNIATSSIYSLDSLGRIVEIKLSEKVHKKIKDSSVLNSLHVSSSVKGKNYLIGIKDREISIYSKSGDLLKEISCDFMPLKAELYLENLQKGRLLVQSVNSELFVYNFKTSSFEKAFNNISAISPISDFDGNGKLNFIAIQDNRIFCYELD
ncbi:MAG: hypothetical protein ACLGGV_03330 [Bacteroidia bacterium]